MFIDLCRFLKSGRISSTIFDKKLGFPTTNHKRIYRLIMNLIFNDWKHLIRTQTSQKSFLKTFYCNNKGTMKVKDFPKLSNKEIYLSSSLLVLNTTSLSCSNFLEGHHILSPEIGGKTLTDWFKKCCDGCNFVTPKHRQHRMDNAPNIMCPRCKELFNFKCNFVSHFIKIRFTTTELSSKKPFEDLGLSFKQ